ncbi:methyltransferase domain-containing protein [Alteraurantiacibacter buctensis]|uniref:Methyltransferase domain-containing protein n=1 Tax=Alteraurantiacibacter buctensis TaxID=1503981 RepID=A0A844YWY0_9SPHN|nr:methyltransferase domain-containing protein [Alteraurantiacibacter buctensis]
MDKSEWEGPSGNSWAAEWRRTDRSFAVLTERLLSRLRGQRFTQAIDIGCGAGELSLAIARGRPDARVVGVDVSPALVNAARGRASNLPNVAFDLADAAAWQPPAGIAPQMLVSRHGVMFFADPTAAFRHLADIADSGAQLLFSCFRDPLDNPFFTEVGRLLPQVPPPPPADAPGPFGFARRERIAQILEGAGWEAVAIDAFDFPMVAGAGDDAVDEAMAYFTSIGPAARVAKELEADARDPFFERLRRLCEDNLRDGVVSLAAAAWIVSARKAG